MFMLNKISESESTTVDFCCIVIRDNLATRMGLLNIIITQNFVYNYNGGHRRSFEGHAGTDAITAGTDAEAR